MKPENIIGAFMGIKEISPENGLLREQEGCAGRILVMRGYTRAINKSPRENGGILYWDALEYLKNRGIKHIVIAFPQIITDSVLKLVEFPNQIAKEIGTKNWLYWAAGDDKAYPGIGHPFAEYWGMWVATDCGGQPCCFEMGGCGDGRPYPPLRQAPLNESEATWILL